MSPNVKQSELLWKGFLILIRIQISFLKRRQSDITVDYATVDVFQPDVIPWKKRSEDFKKLLKGELTCSVLGDFEDFEVEEDVSLTPRIG
jgi:hypothetical protein